MDTAAVKTKWVADPTHSELLFKVKHLMITNVKGEFRKFEASYNGEGNGFDPSSITAEIDASTIFTNNEDRDNHLKSGDFFDAETYPKLIFKGKSMKKSGDDEYKVTGDLTIKDVTKELTIDVEFGGIATDPWGNKKAGFSLSGKINRKDWGLTWNQALESGGVLVSEEVKIMAEIQFTTEG